MGNEETEMECKSSVRKNEWKSLIEDDESTRSLPQGRDKPAPGRLSTFEAAHSTNVSSIGFADTIRPLYVNSGWLLSTYCCIGLIPRGIASHEFATILFIFEFKTRHAYAARTVKGPAPWHYSMGYAELILNTKWHQTL